MTDSYLTAFLFKIRGVIIALWMMMDLIYRMISRGALMIGLWVPSSWTLGAFFTASLTSTLREQLTSTRLSMGTPRVSNLLHIRRLLRLIGRSINLWFYSIPGLYSLVNAPNPPASNWPDCANAFHSIKCRCQQKLLSCVPEDGEPMSSSKFYPRKGRESNPLIRTIFLPLYAWEGQQGSGGQFNRHFEFWMQNWGSKLGHVLGQIPYKGTLSLEDTEKNVYRSAPQNSNS